MNILKLGGGGGRKPNFLTLKGAEKTGRGLKGVMVGGGKGNF